MKTSACRDGTGNQAFHQERTRPAKVRTCNSIKFETSQNLPPILKTVSWLEVTNKPKVCKYCCYKNNLGQLFWWPQSTCWKPLGACVYIAARWLEYYIHKRWFFLKDLLSAVYITSCWVGMDLRCHTGFMVYDLDTWWGLTCHQTPSNYDVILDHVHILFYRLFFSTLKYLPTCQLATYTLDVRYFDGRNRH